jgi:DNA-binding MarR family transcriptional regulator
MRYFQIAHNLAVLRRRSHAFIVERCHRLDLTYAEFAMLMQLYEQEGQSQEEVAQCLYLDKAAVTRISKLLEEKNILYREKDDKDRRIKRFYLTEFGHSQREFLEGVLKCWIDYMAEDMMDKEREAFLQQLSKLADRAVRTDFSKV